MSKFFRLALVVIIIIAAFVTYLKMNPPLESSGITFYSDRKHVRVIEIENKGFTDLRIKEVLVNGDQAKHVELGVSTTNHIVAGGGLDEDPNITFHSIEDLPIPPALTPEEKKELAEQGNTTQPRHFGLRITHDKKIETISVQYTYFFIPYKLEVDAYRE